MYINYSTNHNPKISILKPLSCLSFKMLNFGLCFAQYFLKLSAGIGVLLYLNFHSKISIYKPFNYYYLSSLYVCMAIKYIKRACELNKSHIISTDEDPGLRIESFAVINLRGVSTNKTIIYYYLIERDANKISMLPSCDLLNLI
jgi:hypothetical protein